MLIEDSVLSFITRHGLVSPKDTILVGVSGGADSVCLLGILASLRARLGFAIHVAHLDHRLRGQESEEDARYVAGLAGRWGVPATVAARDVRCFRDQHRLSLEDAARQVRYRFFAEVAADVGAASVAVGHTSSDQVETILMHLVRGAGPTGLLGMSPASTWTSRGLDGLTIIRPLLAISREETRTYCRREGLDPREDSSNLSLSPFRNRIRGELLPLLRGYNPRISQAVMRMSETLADELSCLEDQVAQMWPRLVKCEPGAVLVDRAGLSGLHPALQRHLLRRAARELLGDLEDIEWKHIEKMRHALTLRKGKKVMLARMTASVEKAWLRLSMAAPDQGC